MKRLILMTMFVMLAISVTNVIVPNQAQAMLMPSLCTIAQDAEWRNPSYNTLCEWALQMDPGWNQDGEGAWHWTYLEQQNENDSQLIPAEMKQEAMYAMTDGEINKVIWYPLRT